MAHRRKKAEKKVKHIVAAYIVEPKGIKKVCADGCPACSRSEDIAQWEQRLTLGRAQNAEH